MRELGGGGVKQCMMVAVGTLFSLEECVTISKYFKHSEGWERDMAMNILDIDIGFQFSQFFIGLR